MRKGTRDATWALLVLITATGGAGREVVAALRNRGANDGAQATTTAPPPVQR